MPLPKLNPPPQQWFDQNGRLTRQAAEWIDVFWRKLGAASDVAPISVTGKSDNITGILASANQAPNTQATSTNRATVDSVDVGYGTAIRVYGVGGIGTPWTREVGGAVEGTFPAAYLPGYDYQVTRDVYYSEQDKSFYTFDPDTQFAESLKDEYRWAGRVKTVAAGGTGGTTGGGGISGGSGGSASTRSNGDR